MKIDILRIGLDPLLHFDSIAKCKSLKKASEELGLSQPAVTQSLNKLEKNLGVQLCVRSRTSFSLTEAGKKLFQVSQELKSALTNYESFLSDGSEFDGLLNIGVIDNFQNKAFEDAIRKTIRAFPKMKLSLQVYTANEIQALVSSGEVDLGLGIFNRKMEHLTYRTIGTETIGHYISKNHPLWSKRSLQVDDLKDYAKTWVDIVSRDRSSLNNEIFKDGKKRPAQIKSYTSNLNTAVQILHSGTSIVPLPIEYLESRSLDFKYRSLNKIFPPYALKLEVATHREFLNASPAAKFFLELLPKFAE